MVFPGILLKHQSEKRWPGMPEIRDKKQITLFPDCNRKMRFKNLELLANLPDEKTYISHGTDATPDYNIQIPYDMWMNENSLQISRLLSKTVNKYRRNYTIPDGCTKASSVDEDRENILKVLIEVSKIVRKADILSVIEGDKASGKRAVAIFDGYFPEHPSHPISPVTTKV